MTRVMNVSVVCVHGGGVKINTACGRDCRVKVRRRRDVLTCG
jgi:hypothetical protein